MLLNFHFDFFFFQNKGFHFYYCNYCGECLNSMTKENIQAHLNDCSQHSSKFICRECGMVSENFTICKKLYCSQHSSEFICHECRISCSTYTSILQFKKTLFVLFLQIHETPYPSFSSLSSKSSKRDHKDDEK